MANEELEGNTLNVYAYIVHADGPVGLRDVTRGAELSSTSVTHHHLQKLEASGLIEKNSYGQYTLKKKAPIEGHVWVGKNLVPQLLLYSFFFIGAFAAEVIILLLSLVITSLVIETTFWFLMVITLVAMFIFIKEGVALNRKLNPKRAIDKK
ncbi:MAG: hypothetical protein LBH79_06305 [Nitrososphaerota archaeon]|jgi:cellulose synthase/poly-beta-1,6-N-acetylglucosamine synthase-like glycosyltransferase|nr:hypothetical protein [Nitrososphaerota archaeon]